ncbi:MAG TPA: diguanylate cyclase [Moraxellaceae bacterium]|nr:diguanylate cyclase [Moraxellaceae bacterium]
MNRSPTTGAIAAGMREIQALLDSTRPWYRFAPRLEAAFGDFLRDRVLHMLQSGWWVLLLFYAFVGISTFSQVYLLSAAPLRESNLQVWWTIFLIEGLPIAGLLLLPRLGLLRRHFHVAISLIAVFAISVITIGTSAFRDPYFNQHSSYVVVFILALVYGIGAFRLTGATVVGLSAALISWRGIVAGGLWLDPGLFQQYVLVSNAVGMMLCYMVEQRDRRMFLQGQLLQLEKEELDLFSEELERLSCEDGLTGLANRRHFNETFQQEWERARREVQPLALVFVDVDHFKPFNDTYGHLEGDAVLGRVGMALRECLRRPGDLAARYGGEEFVLLLPGTPAGGALEVARQAHQAIADLGIPHRASGAATHVTASLGVAAVVPGAGMRSVDLLAAADAATYAAKGAGRNRIMLATVGDGAPVAVA